MADHYYYINGNKMPDYDECEPESTDLYGENTGRDESGVNHLDLIRAGVRKWKFSHKMLTAEEVRKISKSLNPLGFQFKGLFDGEVVTANCYGNIKRKQRAVASTKVYWDCEVTIIEN